MTVQCRVTLADITAPGRTTVMGIVNVTEDSFSDGGQCLAPEAALAHAPIPAAFEDVAVVARRSRKRM